jgi:hypothetical protein
MLTKKITGGVKISCMWKVMGCEVYPLLPMLVFQHFLAIVIVACCGTNAADDFLTAISNKLSSDIYIVASPTSVHVI